MTTRFGPWTTEMSSLRNPELSRLWRVRLRSLSQTSQTVPSTSGRPLCGLAMFALLVAAVPTVFPDARLAVGQLTGRALNVMAATPDDAEAVTEELPPEVVAVLGDARLRHWDIVRAVDFSHDGRWIASAGGGTVRVWNAATGRLQRVLRGHERVVFDVEWSPDGQLLASGSIDGEARIWNASDGTLLNSLPQAGAAVAFAPDGRTLVTGYIANGTVSLWSSETGARLLQIDVGQAVKGLVDGGIGASVHAVAVRPDGLAVAAAATIWRNDPQIGRPTPGEAALVMIDARSGQTLQVLTGHTRTVRGVAFHPEGRLLASCSEDSTVRMWDVAAGNEIWRVDHDRFTYEPLFTGDGGKLVVGMGDSVHVFEAMTGHELRRFPPQDLGPGCVALSPDERTLVSGGHRLHVWDFERAQERLHPGENGHAGDVGSVAFSPDGRRIASGGSDHLVLVWDVASRRIVRRLKAHTSSVDAVEWSPSGEFIASVGSGGTTILWDAATGRQRRTLGTKFAQAVEFSPDNQTLALLTGSGVELWSVNQGLLSHRFPFFSKEGQGVSLSADGTLVAGHGHVWDLTTKELKVRVEPTYGPLALSPDGRTLASGSPVTLWDVETGAERATLAAPRGYVSWVTFSPDGDRLATANSDGTVRLWETAHGGELKSIQLAPGETRIPQVAFSPDGSLLATANPNGTITLLSTEIQP